MLRIEPHALFCSRGKSEKPADQVQDKGCSCFGCGLFSQYELEKGYFCMPWEFFFFFFFQLFRLIKLFVY